MSRRLRPMAQINVVPYIDVMLVLLIIFMVTAPLLEEGLALELPAADGGALPAETAPLRVSIDAAGRLYLDAGLGRERLDETALRARVAAALAAEPDRPVLLHGDRNLPYQRVVAVIEILQGAGARRLGLVSRPDEAR
ncbi:MAG: protein TolR [Gammaproteobacteria bacterium]|nr:MAG: protein TolR [Gammaproteobacteria bacterium]